MSVTEIASLDSTPGSRIGLIESARSEAFRLPEEFMAGYVNSFRPEFDARYRGYDTAASLFGHKCILTAETHPDGIEVRSLLFHLRGSRYSEAIAFIEVPDQSVYIESHTYFGNRIITAPEVPKRDLLSFLVAHAESLAVSKNRAITY